jgi:GNAT superfamily N-acetyltransferase
MSQPLITGWEPDLPAGDSLLRQFVLSYADRTEATAVVLGGAVDRDDDACVVDLASPFMFDNAVVLLRPPTPERLDRTLARARALYPAGRSWILLSVWPLPDPAGYGLGLLGHPPLMVRPGHSGALSTMPPAELRIQPVTSELDMAVFHRVLLDGFGLSGDGGSMADPRVLAAGVNLFVGYAGSTPVAVAGSALNHGLVEVDWVTTVPEARGRGYGTALTWRALDIAPELPAVLLASDPGQRVYERMGFLRLLRATMWVSAEGAAA